METHPAPHESERPPLPASPTSCCGSNGDTTGAAPPLTPRSTPKAAEPKQYPITFVQADTNSFKQVVQMLTGSAETAAAAGNPSRQAMASAKAPGPKKPPFKLYERRNHARNLRIVSPMTPSFQPGPTSAFSPRKQPEIPSPSMLDFPALALSPVTPLIPDPFNRSPLPGSEVAAAAEEMAIAEKGFYLHPSPRSAEPPRLLPLFPMTSPGVPPSSPAACPRSPREH